MRCRHRRRRSDSIVELDLQGADAGARARAPCARRALTWSRCVFHSQQMPCGAKGTRSGGVRWGVVRVAAVMHRRVSPAMSCEARAKVRAKRGRRRPGRMLTHACQLHDCCHTHNYCTPAMRGIADALETWQVHVFNARARAPSRCHTSHARTPLRTYIRAPQYQLVLLRQRCDGNCVSQLLASHVEPATSHNVPLSLDAARVRNARRACREVRHGRLRTRSRSQPPALGRRRTCAARTRTSTPWRRRSGVRAVAGHPPPTRVPTTLAARELTDARNETQTLATRCQGLDAGARRCGRCSGPPGPAGSALVCRRLAARQRRD